MIAVLVLSVRMGHVRVARAGALKNLKKKKKKNNKTKKKKKNENLKLKKKKRKKEKINPDEAVRHLPLPQRINRSLFLVRCSCSDARH